MFAVWVSFCCNPVNGSSVPWLTLKQEFLLFSVALSIEQHVYTSNSFNSCCPSVACLASGCGLLSPVVGVIFLPFPFDGLSVTVLTIQSFVFVWLCMVQSFIACGAYVEMQWDMHRYFTVESYPWSHQQVSWVRVTFTSTVELNRIRYLNTTAFAGMTLWTIVWVNYVSKEKEVHKLN